MSLGSLETITLAAMLSGEMEVNKLDIKELELIKNELNEYYVKVGTQTDLVEMLGNLDLGEGKKIDMASLVKYAGLEKGNNIVTDAGSIEKTGMTIEEMHDFVKKMSYKHIDDWMIDLLSPEEIEKINSLYIKSIEGIKLNTEEKARVLMATICLILGDGDIRKSMEYIYGEDLQENKMSGRSLLKEIPVLEEAIWKLDDKIKLNKFEKEKPYAIESLKIALTALEKIEEKLDKETGENKEKHDAFRSEIYSCKKGLKNIIKFIKNPNDMFAVLAINANIIDYVKETLLKIERLKDNDYKLNPEIKNEINLRWWRIDNIIEQSKKKSRLLSKD